MLRVTARTARKRIRELFSGDGYPVGVGELSIMEPIWVNIGTHGPPDDC